MQGRPQQIHVELGCNQRVFIYFNIFSSFFFFPGLCHNSWTQFGGSFIKGSGLWKNWQAVRVDLNSPALFHHVGELAFLTEMFSSGSNGRLWKAGAHQPQKQYVIQALHLRESTATSAWTNATCSLIQALIFQVNVQ